MRYTTLSDWLDWQQTLHPREIDLGLERVREVAGRLGVLSPGCPVITVGGTNGKGSCVAYLSACLRADGRRVGTYTSPHLLRYNERVRVDGEEISDAELIASFDRIDRARGRLSLTYFEFGTLAALDIFRRRGCQVWVLEVGLGGRLDAVNAVDPDVAVITSVGLDHTDWLGADRERIGVEKAGIFRPGRAAVYGEADPPASVLEQAERLGVQLYLAGRDYDWHDRGADWNFRGLGCELAGLPRPRLAGEYQLGNAAAALAALSLLSSPPAPRALYRGIGEARLAGRFQVLPGDVEWILDVAHNRDSARNLCNTLAARPTRGRTLGVFAQMRRKELEPVLAELAGEIDEWWLLDLPDADARPAADVAQALSGHGVPPAAQAAPAALFEAVSTKARAGDRVVVFGSFRTVEEALRHRGYGRLDDADEGELCNSA